MKISSLCALAEGSCRNYTGVALSLIMHHEAGFWLRVNRTFIPIAPNCAVLDLVVVGQ
ncbi:MAG: hypothetical protein M3Y24_09780 [Acidobacteriota bacterium]|nr:hypothetical protein [Acidobacteriota bacterium]